MSEAYPRIWSQMAALALAIGAAGCLGTDVGNPQDGHRDTGPTGEEVDVEVRFEGLRKRPTPNQLTLSGGLEIEAAWVVFERFGLRRVGDCNREASMISAGPVAVNLVGDGGEALLPGRSPGEYCGFDAELAPLPAGEGGDEVPDALEGRSILIRGRVDGGPAFELRDQIEFDLELGRPGGTFAIEADARSHLLTFVLESWLEAGDLRELEGDPAVIDADRHADLLVDFREAFRESAYLFRDANADGELQSGERGKVLADSREDYEWEADDEDEEADDVGVDVDDEETGADDGG